HHLGIDQDEAQVFQRIASHILYHDVALRAAREVQKRNRAGPSSLWGHRISGDRPIVVLRIDDHDDLGIARQVLRAWRYWRDKRPAVDLVILNERTSSYDQELQATLDGLVRASKAAQRQQDAPEPGEVHVVAAGHMTAEQIDTLLSLARVVLSSRQGTLSDQV